MPVEMRPAQIDFSALANLGQIPERLRMRDLRNQFSSGQITDYNKLVQALGAVDPVAAARTWAAGQEAEALAGYRGAVLDAQSRPKYTYSPEAGGFTSDRSPEIIPPVGGDVAPTNPYAPRGKMTEGEGKAGTFVTRMAESHKIITDLEGLVDSSKGEMAATRLLGSENVTPFASSDVQRIEQAKRDFINAVLRRESGATIQAAEFANADQQYFPQVGDGPEVIAQKRRNRLTAMQGMAREAGRNFTVPDGVSYDPVAATTPADALPELEPGPMTGRAFTQPIDPSRPPIEMPALQAEVAKGGFGKQPPTPPARALNALKAHANNPEARAVFDSIYGEGAADFYLTKSR